MTAMQAQQTIAANLPMMGFAKTVIPIELAVAEFKGTSMVVAEEEAVGGEVAEATVMTDTHVGSRSMLKS